MDVSIYFGKIHTNGPVFCEARAACWYAHIYTIDRVYCDGQFSCKGSSITSVGDLIVYLLGYKSGLDSTITCASLNTCSIICKGYQSCLGVTLVSNGICAVDCNENTACPNGWTASPTSAPFHGTTAAVLYDTTMSSMTANSATVPFKILTIRPMASNPSSTPSDKASSTLYFTTIDNYNTTRLIFIIVGCVLLCIVIIICICCRCKMKSIDNEQRLGKHNQDNNARKCMIGKVRNTFDNIKIQKCIGPDFVDDNGEDVQNEGVMVHKIDEGEQTVEGELGDQNIQKVVSSTDRWKCKYYVTVPLVWICNVLYIFVNVLPCTHVHTSPLTI
eukprot:915828_1